MTTLALVINQVAKYYKQKTALHPFSLTANEGECIALCGGNGAGKSTILHILTGISEPSEGTVMIKDIDLNKKRKAYLSLIGYMPDEFHAQETLTVTEFLTFYAALQEIPRQQVNEIIRILGLEEKKHELVKHLSKGMRQRLMFGQAWVRNPEVLILDEPTNGLDPYWIDVFIDLLNQIKKSGTTIIFSTHMMDVAAETADRVIFMEDGKQTSILVNTHVNPQAFTEELLQFYRNKEKSDGDMV